VKLSVSLLSITTLAIASSSPAWGQTLSRQTLAPLALAEIPADVTPATTEPEPAPATAPDESPQAIGDEGWKFSASIPIWLVGVEGDVVVHGHDLDVDQDTADDVDELFDSRLNAAMALHFEAAKSRFGLLLDAMYLDRSVEGTLDTTDANGFLRGFIGEVGAFYTVVAPPPDKRGFGRLSVDALGGVRISALELGVESDTFNGAVHRTFYDPYVGARLELGLTNWLSLKVRGDVGGFGIEAWPTSDFSWNVDTALAFHLASWFDLGLGYRWLDYDFNGPSDSSLNATLSGPIVELRFNF
jgi:hypothetical protein